MTKQMQLTAVILSVAVLGLAGTAQADVWSYNFDGFSLSTSAADSWGFLPQVTTTEGWVTGGSSTTTLPRGMIVADPDGTGNVINSNWGAGNYVNARVSYGVGGGQGTIATITDMATAPKITYTWDVQTGVWSSGNGRGFQWDIGVYEGATQRLSLGWNNWGVNPGDGISPWKFETPAGTFDAAKLLVYSEWNVVKLEVDLATNRGTVYFNDVADANLTNIDLVGASGVNLRNAKDIWVDQHGGSTRSLMASTGSVEPPSFHPGDANEDGSVDLQDFGLLKENFGIEIGGGALWTQGDFNKDGGIDLQDFGILKDHFGHTSGSVPITAVPEPATMSLLALAGLGLLRKRTR